MRLTGMVCTLVPSTHSCQLQCMPAVIVCQTYIVLMCSDWYALRSASANQLLSHKMLCLQMGFGWTNGAVLFLLDRFGWHPSTEALA